MASTGAFRQALQQLFVIQIEDDMTQLNNNGFNGEEIGQDEFSPSFDEFEDEENKETVNNGQNMNVENVVSIGNMQNTQELQNNQVTSINEVTENYIDQEFANF